MIGRLKEVAKKSLTLRRAVRLHRFRSGQPRWHRLLTEDAELWATRPTGGPRVLIATGTGGYLAGTTMESMLAVALQLRGAQVDVLLCDGALPACQLCWVGFHAQAKEFADRGPGVCRDCFEPAERVYRRMGLKVHRYGGLVSGQEAAEARRLTQATPFAEVGSLRLDGLAVGEHAMAGALRFFARGDLREEPQAEPVLRRYLEASLRTAFAMRRLLHQGRYDCVVFHHGIYVPQGVVGEVCRQRGVRVVNWTPAYRKRSFIFSHGDTYHRTMVSEPVTEWADMPWTDAQRDELRAYLKGRWTGKEDWIWFHQDPRFDVEAFAAASGLKPGRPRVGFLTSVMWDAQLHYESNAFPSMLDCILETIHYFAQRPDLDLVIRVHPAELRGTLPARQRVVDEVARVFPTLPSNVVLVGPEHPISTYALMDTCDTVVVYNTKTGIEMAAVGIPVIVAGEAWIRNKGFAIDVDSPAGYRAALDRLPLGRRMSDADRERAEKYAYHFFFRRMIVLGFMRSTGSDPPYALQLASLRELLPEADAGLDVICRGILEDAPFVYPAEKMAGGESLIPTNTTAV